MNFQMKYDCTKTAYGICSKMYNKGLNFEHDCKNIGNTLDLKIDESESILSTTKITW